MPPHDPLELVEDPRLKRLFERARDVLRDRSITRFCFLGLGLDPLTTKPELLFCITSDWDQITSFGALPMTPNIEGKIAAIPLSKFHLKSQAMQVLGNRWMLPAGAACLHLCHAQFEVLFDHLGVADSQAVNLA
jgi:hypothetical protein